MRYLFILAILSFSSCSKLDVVLNKSSENGEFVSHVIKEGNHNSESNKIKIFSDSILNFTVVFDSTAIYKTSLPENQMDINKLYGFSDCGSQHHTNSARFGWRWNGKEIDILAYTYADGKRSHKLIGHAEIGKELKYSLAIKANKYVFKLNDITVTMDRSCDSGNAKGYLLYPYFGGDEPAPHTINVLIKEI